ncbi:DUF1985 domain-containing protein [Raphanus sativus]|nr:DUF1985 domain-containing protein [Raphanus sativus]
MLTRQLVCDDKHTLWSVFGSDPIKFGLKEFGTITGLPCGAFPVGYTTEREDQSKAHKDPYWIQLIGKKKFPTIADLRHKLETDTTLSGGQKLQSTIPIPVDNLTIMDLDVPHLPLYTAPSMLDITNVECHPNLQVTSLIPIHSQPQPGWGVWPDVYNDDRLSYMEQLIVDKYEFKKEFWPGGHIPKLTAPHPTNKKQPLLPKAPLKRKLKSDPISEALKPRRTCKKSVTARKQRRISSYFGKPASSPNSNEKILEVLSAILVKVSNIEKNQKQLRKLVTSKKIKRHHKSSAFHILLDHTKKGNRSHRGCQTDQQQEDTPSHHKSPEHMEEDQPLEPSLVVSQYEAHLHGSTSNSKHGPSNQSPPVHTSPSRSSPLQKSPVHSSPVHKSPIHSSPVHESPVHESPVHKSPVHKSPIHSSPVPESPIHKSPVHKSPIHSSPVPESPIHKSPVHKSPIHQTPVHTSPVNNSPFIKNPFAQTIATPPSLRLPSVIYDASAHPNSPELHHILFDAPTPCSEPTKIRLFSRSSFTETGLSFVTLRFTPDTSPNKSGDSLPGFIAHSSAINAFSATATSNPIHVANTISSNIQTQQTVVSDGDVGELTDVVELSDGSPSRERERYMPSLEENHLQKNSYAANQSLQRLLSAHYLKYSGIFSRRLLTSLKQQASKQNNKILLTADRFHITPSKFNFSNNLLLQLAKPKQWTTTLQMELLMHMLAERHKVLLEDQKLAFTTPHLTGGIQAVSKEFLRKRKRENFEWDEDLTDITAWLMISADSNALDIYKTIVMPAYYAPPKE